LIVGWTVGFSSSCMPIFLVFIWTLE